MARGYESIAQSGRLCFKRRAKVALVRENRRSGKDVVVVVEVKVRDKRKWWCAYVR